jgi:hypothetical protein
VALKRRGKIGNIVSRAKAISAGLFCRIRGGTLDDDGNVVARDVWGRDTARDYRRSPFRVHSAGSVSFAHGQGRGVQSPQATRCRIDNCGQLLVGAIGGAIFGLFVRRTPGRIPAIVTMLIFVLLPIVVFAIALWPVLGTSYIGLPIQVARLVTLIGFVLCVLLFERTLVTGFRFLTAGVAAATHRSAMVHQRVSLR